VTILRHFSITAENWISLWIAALTARLSVCAKQGTCFSPKSLIAFTMLAALSVTTAVILVNGILNAAHIPFEIK
jgi:hypothetical protein